MLRTAAPPKPGTYVEIQLGSGVVAARAMWVADQSCGLRSQDKLNVAALRGTRAGAASEAKAPAAPVQRPRASVSAHERAERSRQLSSLTQYATLAVVGMAAALSLGWEVFQVLSAPVNVIEAKLN